jgi:hypothetical protein
MGGSGRTQGVLAQNPLPYLARRRVVKKRVVRSSLVNDAQRRGDRRHGRLGLSLASLQQLQHCGAGAMGGGGRCMLDQYRILRRSGGGLGGGKGWAEGSAGIVLTHVRYAWHLSAEDAPDPTSFIRRSLSDAGGHLGEGHNPRGGAGAGGGEGRGERDSEGFVLPDLISVASEEFSSSPSKLPSGGWKVTAALEGAGAAQTDHGKLGRWRNYAGKKDLRAAGTASGRIKGSPRVPRTGSMPVGGSDVSGSTRASALKHSSSMPARGAAEVGVGVSLGLIHHRQDVRLGLLLLRACPQAIETVDEALSALHNNASSVEGCLDILRSLARDPVHILKSRYPVTV